MPSVSVIIPTYNRRGYLQEAIDSVLAQTFTDYEIIVIDDGSTDGTGENVTARYGERVRYVWQANQGESAARNKGISLAQGEYVAFLDSDDLWLPEKLEKQVGPLDSDPRIGLVFCYALAMDERGVTFSQPPWDPACAKDDLTFEDLCTGNLVNCGGSTVMMRRSLLDTTGWFDGGTRYGEDWDLWLRVSLVSAIKCIPGSWARVRLHRGGQWWAPRRETVNLLLADHLRILERAFARWRGDAQQAAVLRSTAMAQEYATAAWANYALGETKLACQQLQDAVNRDPRTWADETRLIREIALTAVHMNRTRGDAPLNPSRYVDTVLGDLPACVHPLRLRRREIQARAELEVGYERYASGNHVEGRWHILRALLLDPRHMKNRGALALFLESFLGRKAVHALRGILGRLEPGTVDRAV